MLPHWFIVPALDGPVSGGTLYNRQLIGELCRLGVHATRLDEAAAERALGAGGAGCYWVDSLYLNRFEAFWQLNRGRRTLGLLAHYLPSLVERGDKLEAAQLSDAEAFTLRHADAAVAPSSYMKSTLVRLGFGKPERCFVVEPGCSAPRALGEPVTCDGVRALLVGNLTPGKGVEPFLRALGAELSPDDALRLTIVGSLAADESYARSCIALVDSNRALAPRVSFAGGLTPERVVAELSARNLLVSASRMESFGMVLAEARTLGVPVAARAGGNCAALVVPHAGGALVDGARALARACVSFARDRGAHTQAAELAWRHARPPRSFADAARELVAQLSTAGFADIA